MDTRDRYIDTVDKATDYALELAEVCHKHGFNRQKTERILRRWGFELQDNTIPFSSLKEKVRVFWEGAHIGAIYFVNGMQLIFCRAEEEITA